MKTSLTSHPSPFSPQTLLLLWAPVIAWAGLIFYFSSIPDLKITQEWYDIILRKIAHVLVFAVLGRLFARALTGSTYWSWTKIFYTSLALTLAYAISDEFHQTFVEGRNGAPMDVLIDLAGAWVALGLKPD